MHQQLSRYWQLAAQIGGSARALPDRAQGYGKVVK